MLFNLPDFDYLKKLAAEDPEELDFLCHFYSRRIIDNAPAHYQNRLNGLLFQIEVSRQRSNNPLHSCINLSKMMMDSFDNLTDALSRYEDGHSKADHSEAGNSEEKGDGSVATKKKFKTAEVFQFNR